MVSRSWYKNSHDGTSENHFFPYPNILENSAARKLKPKTAMPMDTNIPIMNNTILIIMPMQPTPPMKAPTATPSPSLDVQAPMMAPMIMAITTMIMMMVHISVCFCR